MKINLLKENPKIKIISSGFSSFITLVFNLLLTRYLALQNDLFSSSFLFAFSILAILRSCDFCIQEYVSIIFIRNNVKNKSNLINNELLIKRIFLQILFSFREIFLSRAYIYKLIIFIYLVVFINLKFLFNQDLINSLLITLLICIYYFLEMLDKSFYLVCEANNLYSIGMFLRIIYRTLSILALLISYGKSIIFLLLNLIIFSLIFFFIIFFKFYFLNNKYKIFRKIKDIKESLNIYIKTYKKYSSKKRWFSLSIFFPMYFIPYLIDATDIPLTTIMTTANDAKDLFYCYSLARVISVWGRITFTSNRSTFARYWLNNELKNCINLLKKLSLFTSVLYLISISILLFVIKSNILINLGLPEVNLRLLFIVCLSEMLCGFIYPLIDYLSYLGKVKYNFYMILTIAINLIGSIILGLRYGVNGIAAATGFAVLIVSTPLFFTAYRKEYLNIKGKLSRLN